MKTLNLFVGLTVALFATEPLLAQGFQNLDFEQANVASSIYYPISVNAFSALPHWLAFVGTTTLMDVWLNGYTLGTASVDIFGPGYPAAEVTPGFAPGVIDGNYSVLLQAGGDPNTGMLEAASIAQIGVMPPSAQTLEFKAWQTYSAVFTVSFNGNNLSPVVLGSGANYTLYGVNVSPYDGQTGVLEFSAQDTAAGASYLGLDDISFSTSAIVPEPNIVALTSIGALLFAARMWFGRAGVVE